MLPFNEQEMQKRPIDQLFDSYVVQPSIDYRAAIGEPVNLTPEGFSHLLDQLRDFRNLYQGMAFWLIIRYKDLSISDSAGDEEFFGRKLRHLIDFYRIIHPDYILPYLRWRAAAYALIHNQHVQPPPLDVGYRQSVPLKAKDGAYYWFTMYSSIAQTDAAQKIVSNLQTFSQEGKWTPRNLRPFEATIQSRNFSHSDLEEHLMAQLSLSLIDEFTNAELDLLSFYAAGKTVEDILERKSWSRHTLHEYNASLLKKAKNLFVYDFRNAREFAGYCLEKGFIHAR